MLVALLLFGEVSDCTVEVMVIKGTRGPASKNKIGLIFLGFFCF